MVCLADSALTTILVLAIRKSRIGYDRSGTLVPYATVVLTIDQEEDGRVRVRPLAAIPYQYG